MQSNVISADVEGRILIVDDDKGLRSVISRFLEKHGFRTASACNPIEMREQLKDGTFDLIVLDLMMPKENGLTALRSLGPDAPAVIMLSAVGTDFDRVVGLEVGADDYLAKPCNPRELLARIRAVLRRKIAAQAIMAQAMALVAESTVSPATPALSSRAKSLALVEPVVLDQAPSANALLFEGWTMDLDMRMLFDPKNRMITLTDGEFRLLRAFAEHPRRVLTRDQLLDWSRGEDTDYFDRAIDVQLSRLRRKLAVAGGAAAGELIRTVRNEGYLFVPQVARTGLPTEQ